MTKPLLDVLSGRTPSRPPVWLMRQAGRYLPEYRAIRGRASGFLDFCYTPELAVEATLQPIRRFGFDGAILFSDILVVPDALGQKVWFEEGEGPRLEPVTGRGDLAGLRDQIDLDHLAPVLETVRRVKGQLPPAVTFLGFCGGPWTVATYMIAGRGVKDQVPARLAAYQDPDFFAALIDRLIEASIDYLCAQIEAGVDAVQIFDSWAGILPPDEFERWAIEPARRIVEGVRARHPLARIIGFPRGAGSLYVDYARAVDVDAIGLDWCVDPAWAAANVQTLKPVQGNLDPLALVAGGDALDRALDRILGAFSGQPFIFNLGHGIVPQTPIAHVERMLERIRAQA
ncbi:uroporphyrinogen decarboxylase [Labrys monachus]|uniref:Uroporphyrinogen decarboxylase n=1 Tax=Labrys monachus TaxID=217067 RepID=A0ABU0FN60_9HYPH|nr:uroporphyrinogen decarboxylase [Labrys monachus]MDQ0396056.1 uroporphyrinogen decarboxylase [Labrys monachus]